MKSWVKWHLKYQWMWQQMPIIPYRYDGRRRLLVPQRVQSGPGAGQPPTCHGLHPWRRLRPGQRQCYTGTSNIILPNKVLVLLLS